MSFKCTRYTDGELLLAHILIHSPLFHTEKANILNDVWHNGEEIRKKKSIEKLNCNANYRKMREAVSEFYLGTLEKTGSFPKADHEYHILSQRPHKRWGGHKPITEGELLCAYIIARGNKNRENLRNLVNFAWHKGEKGRSQNTINVMIDDRTYRQKILSAKRKYLQNQDQ